MAFMAVLMGGVMGFGSFLVSFFFYDWSLLGAFGLYSGVGILCTLALITISLIRQSLSGSELRNLSRANT